MWLLQANAILCDPSTNFSMQCPYTIQWTSWNRNLYYSSLISYSSSVFACIFTGVERTPMNGIMVPCPRKILNPHFAASGMWLVSIPFWTAQSSEVSCLQFWRGRFQKEVVLPMKRHHPNCTHVCHMASITYGVFLAASVQGGSVILVCRLEGFLSQPCQFITGVFVQVVAKSM